MPASQNVTSRMKAPIGTMRTAGLRTTLRISRRFDEAPAPNESKETSAEEVEGDLEREVTNAVAMFLQGNDVDLNLRMMLRLRIRKPGRLGPPGRQPGRCQRQKCRGQGMQSSWRISTATRNSCLSFANLQQGSSSWAMIPVTCHPRCIGKSRNRLHGVDASA